KAKLAVTNIVEQMEDLQAQLEVQKEKLAIASRPSDVRIQEFMEASKQFLANVRKGYEANMQELREQLAKAEEAGEDVRKIKADMKRLGDGSVKVKVYMRLNETQRLAEEHKKEVAANLPKILDHVYHPGERYDVSYKMIDPTSEGMYGDIAGDFAAENIIKKAIERAQQTGRIDNSDAAGVKDG